MNESLLSISLLHLSIVLIPVLGIIFLMYKWELNYKESFLAIFRMLLQLMLIGYFLTFIFKSEHAVTVLAVLVVMLLASAWIALRTVKTYRKKLFLRTLAAIILGGGFTLILVTQGVLQLDPWFDPKFMIPLAGMIFANAMNSVSLAAERVTSELNQGRDFNKARGKALITSLIPITNALFAVGLVSIPGMMTGQILSGVSPLIAARYQIMVMLMVFSSAGISSAIFLVIARSLFLEESME
jgi:putative ABC transport system permease protein